MTIFSRFLSLLPRLVLSVLAFLVFSFLSFFVFSLSCLFFPLSSFLSCVSFFQLTCVCRGDPVKLHVCARLFGFAREFNSDSCIAAP